MLTMSCINLLWRLRMRAALRRMKWPHASRRALRALLSMRPSSWLCGPLRSLHVESEPVLGADDTRFRSVPLVHAIELARAEVVVLGPFDRTAAQTFGVDLHGLHRGCDRCGRCGPAGGVERRF